MCNEPGDHNKKEYSLVHEGEKCTVSVTFMILGQCLHKNMSASDLEVSLQDQILPNCPSLEGITAIYSNHFPSSSNNRIKTP